MTETFALTLLIFAAALLYSSVGHAGASGYLAAMALFGLAPAVKNRIVALDSIICDCKTAVSGAASVQARKPCRSRTSPCA